MIQTFSARRVAAFPRIFARWESVLALLLIATFVMNTLLSPYFLDLDNLLDSTYTFAEKAMIAFFDKHLKAK